MPWIFPSATLLVIGTSNAQELEHAFIVGVGAASELELGDGSLHPGVNVFVEYEAIADWLELELGISILKAEGGHEVPIDLLIKKPFQLTRHLELMIGIGPEIVRAWGTERSGTSAGGELVFDLMYWPTRHVGVWVEPTYAFLFRNGVSHSLGATGGVIFGWRPP